MKLRLFFVLFTLCACLCSSQTISVGDNPINGGSGSDNLGNHIATQFLDIGDFGVTFTPSSNVTRWNWNNATNSNSFNGGWSNGTFTYWGFAGTGTTNAGIFGLDYVDDRWEIANSPILTESNASSFGIGGGSDNLGDHEATQDLDIASNNILNAVSIDFRGILDAGGSGYMTLHSSDYLKKTDIQHSIGEFRIIPWSRGNTSSSYNALDELTFDYTDLRYEIADSPVVTAANAVSLGFSGGVSEHPDSGQTNIRLGIGNESEKDAATINNNDFYVCSTCSPATQLTDGTAVIESEELVYLDNRNDDVTSFTVNNAQMGDVLVIYLDQSTEPSFTGLTVSIPSDGLQWVADGLADTDLKLTVVVEEDVTGTGVYTRR